MPPKQRTAPIDRGGDTSALRGKQTGRLSTEALTQLAQSPSSSASAAPLPSSSIVTTPEHSSLKSNPSLSTSNVLRPSHPASSQLLQPLEPAPSTDSDTASSVTSFESFQSSTRSGIFVSCTGSPLSSPRDMNAVQSSSPTHCAVRDLTSLSRRADSASPGGGSASGRARGRGHARPPQDCSAGALAARLEEVRLDARAPGTDAAGQKKLGR